MSPVPASAITIANGEITLDAELLAPKLGRSPKSARPRQDRVMTVTASEPAATMNVEDNPSETLATLRLPITLYVGGGHFSLEFASGLAGHGWSPAVEIQQTIGVRT